MDNDDGPGAEEGRCLRRLVAVEGQRGAPEESVDFRCTDEQQRDVDGPGPPGDLLHDADGGVAPLT